MGLYTDALSPTAKKVLQHPPIETEMRHLLLYLFCLCTLGASAYDLSRNTKSALESIEQGLIPQAIQKLKNAVAVNDIAAQFYMGQCYELGIGVETDTKAAFSMYRRAAERGFPIAMKELARCYREGIGVAQNNSRAEEWQNRYLRRNNSFTIPDIIEIYELGYRNSVDNNLASIETNPTDYSASSITIVNSSDDNNTQLRIPQNIVVDKPEQLRILSDVDVDIPITSKKSENVFALIIANENYQDVVAVSNALNDGEIFSHYCTKVLGLPASNVHLIKDATLNNIKREVNLMRQIAEAYNGNASFIVYYAGHGIPDESSKSAFLMPVDGFSSDLSTCYSLADFYEAFGNMPSSKTVILLDACFSGAIRGNGMLASARGVAIKPKACAPSGNTIVISSAQGDETAYPFEEKKHGLFTYFLLKKIKDCKGDISLGSLLDYVKDNVVKKSLVVNGKSQTPTAIPSQMINDEWYNWKLN